MKRGRKPKGYGDRPTMPDLRSAWQIAQGERCGCRATDDLCPCQNENAPWRYGLAPRPPVHDPAKMLDALRDAYTFISQPLRMDTRKGGPKTATYRIEGYNALTAKLRVALAGDGTGGGDSSIAGVSEIEEYAPEVRAALGRQDGLAHSEHKPSFDPDAVHQQATTRFPNIMKRLGDEPSNQQQGEGK